MSGHIHTYTHTYTQDNYSNSRCACAPRVKNEQSLLLKDQSKSKVLGHYDHALLKHYFNLWIGTVFHDLLETLLVLIDRSIHSFSTYLLPYCDN